MKKLTISDMHVGEAGSGKTHFACTFPRWYSICNERDSHWVWELNPDLSKNMVGYDYFIPDEVTLKEMYADPIKGPIQDKIREVKQMCFEDKVDTLIFDNMTYHIMNRWIWQNRYQIMTSDKTGEVDTWGMYGQLRTYAYNFTLMNLVSFPGNLVVNVHIMQESDEAMKKKRDKTIDISPNILGGFRNDVEGLFANIFYLEKLSKGGGQYKYMCRTNKGNGRLAKNRFGLPEVMENVNYQVLIDTINKKKGE